MLHETDWSNDWFAEHTSHWALVDSAICAAELRKPLIIRPIFFDICKISLLSGRNQNSRTVNYLKIKHPMSKIATVNFMLC